jgi:hypothetical protein
MRPFSDLLETSGQIGSPDPAHLRDAAVSVSLSSWTSPGRGLVTSIISACYAASLRRLLGRAQVVWAIRQCDRRRIEASSWTSPGHTKGWQSGTAGERSENQINDQSPRLLAVL